MITTNGQIVVTREGFGEIIRHDIESEAIEAAILHGREHGAGVYLLTFPTKTVEVLSCPSMPPVDPPPDDPPVVPGPNVNFSVNPTSIRGPGQQTYATASWSTDGISAIASSNPPYSAWDGEKKTDWSQSVAPTVTTDLTLTCANEAGGITIKTVRLTVGETPPPDDPPVDPPDDPPPDDPPPTDPPVDPPILVFPEIPAGDPLRDFGETARRNWSHGGHNVPVPFSTGQGYWALNETTYEPWLFDRASVAYEMWARTGDTNWRTEWETLFTFYRTHIDSQGYFTLRPGDTKYCYVKPFVYYERETGDTQYRPIAHRIHDAWVREWSVGIPTTTSFWTEREIGLALEAAAWMHKLTPTDAIRARIAGLIQQWDRFCAGGDAPLHTLAQHGEEFDNEWAPRRMTSPWMAGLYFQSLSDWISISGSTDALIQVSRYCDFLDRRGFADGATVHPQLSGIRLPYYLVGDEPFQYNGQTVYHYARETPDWADLAHGIDVLGLLKFGRFAKQTLGQSTTAIDQRIAQMEATAAREYAYWTRTEPTLPRYRIKPPRKFNWQARGHLLAARY